MEYLDASPVPEFTLPSEEGRNQISIENVDKKSVEMPVDTIHSPHSILSTDKKVKIKHKGVNFGQIDDTIFKEQERDSDLDDLTPGEVSQSPTRKRVRKMESSLQEKSVLSGQSIMDGETH